LRNDTVLGSDAVVETRMNEMQSMNGNLIIDKIDINWGSVYSEFSIMYEGRMPD